MAKIRVNIDRTRAALKYWEEIARPELVKEIESVRSNEAYE